MKIKTKYNINEKILYEDFDGNIKVAEIQDIEIKATEWGINIEYNALHQTKRGLLDINMTENAVLCKATKKLINKYLGKEKK